MPARLPVPGFPQWTGAHATVGGPTTDPDTGRLVAPVTVHLPRRALWWARWRLLTA